MIAILERCELDVTIGGRCECICIYDAEHKGHHHKREVRRESRVVGIVNDPIDCTKVCATLVGGVIEKCASIQQ